jgi:hypothetical protein
LLHRSKLIKPGSSEHDPDFFYRENKADNGTIGTDWHKTLLSKTPSQKIVFFLEKQLQYSMAMLVPPGAHTPAGLRRKAGIRHVGFKNCVSCIGLR